MKYAADEPKSGAGSAGVCALTPAGPFAGGPAGLSVRPGETPLGYTPGMESRARRVWLAVGLATMFLLHRTTLGRAIYGVGNREPIGSAGRPGCAGLRAALACSGMSSAAWTVNDDGYLRAHQWARALASGSAMP